MKLVKMSLAAALLMGASAFAIENVKVSGSASVFYDTFDSDVAGSDYAGNDTSLFDKDSSGAQAGLTLGVTADLTEGVSAGVTVNALSTLGLENNLVSSVWETGTGDYYWFSEAWLAGTAGKTTGKIGRMTLDTPLAFSETWSLAPNTFEAAVLINQDLADTTLVGAYVGKSNAAGSDTSGTDLSAFVGQNLAGDVGSTSGFESFYNGAYAFGIVNNSFKPLTAQAWYYDLQHVATAYWLQADLACEKVPGLSAGAQYAAIDPAAAGAKDSSAYAVMLGYAVEDVASITVAYSSVDDEGVVGIRNTATDFESKLYTEKWWNFGAVGDIGADSYSVTVEGAAAGLDLFAGYYFTDTDVAGTVDDYELTEMTVTAGKSFGPLDVTLAYVYTDVDADGTADDAESDRIQAYLTYNF